MTQNELYEYIKNKKYLCHLCQNLRKEVILYGLEAIKNYKGMACKGIEDMQIKFSEVTDNP